MDPQLTAKFTQAKRDHTKRKGEESKQRMYDFSSRGTLNSGIYGTACAEATSVSMREMAEELVGVAQSHQELRQRPYTSEEILEIEKDVTRTLEGMELESAKGRRAWSSSQGLGSVPGFNSAFDNRVVSGKAEAIGLLRTKLGDLRYYRTPVSPELVVNIVNNINIDMDSLLAQIIQKVEESKKVDTAEKGRLRKLLDELRASAMVRELGKSVIGEAVRLAVKSATGT